jgi:carbamoyltransferase
MASPDDNRATEMRIRPRHHWLGAVGFNLAIPLFERVLARAGLCRSSSPFAAERLKAVRERLGNGETVYIAGINAGGMHNTGVALIEVSHESGPRIICNNEEERFSGKKNTTDFPYKAIDNLLGTMKRIGIGPDHIAAWIATWDHVALLASLVRSMLEEAPASLSLLRSNSAFNSRPGLVRTAAGLLGKQLGLREPVPMIGMPHHDNHAWFSFAASPFAHSESPVMVAVVDGLGDLGSISLYVADRGVLRKLRCNYSTFDSLGIYYSILSSTQGGWTWLSSEGRYMGAAAFGNCNRLTNSYYLQLRQIFSLEPEGQVYLNRSLANWHRSPFRSPYSPALTRLLGEPIPVERMWNPDVVLRLDDTPNTRERADKAAATQMVLEDALFHIIGYLIRATSSDRLILTGGVALNAVANMRLLEHFNEEYYSRMSRERTRLHLWVPPVPGDSGATIGAAYMFAYLAGAPVGPPLEHAFYCGAASTEAEIRAALASARDIGWMCLGNGSEREHLNAIADLMAFITVRDGVLAIFQGSAETGPRALGHRSIVANACNPQIREVLNERVKHREVIRPLAPMMTLAAAKRWFELSDGASDSDYNAYNYMVLTARARPEARSRIPAVIHADGTGRLQIVREHIDPLAYGYLKAVGRRAGVEVAVNTSFNVAGPIAQTATQAIETLRRSKGLDAVLMFTEDGSAFSAWAGDNNRFREWVAAWQRETDATLPLSSTSRR